MAFGTKSAGMTSYQAAACRYRAVVHNISGTGDRIGEPNSVKRSPIYPPARHSFLLSFRRVDQLVPVRLLVLWKSWPSMPVFQCQRIWKPPNLGLLSLEDMEALRWHHSGQWVKVKVQ